MRTTNKSHLSSQDPKEFELDCSSKAVGIVREDLEPVIVNPKETQAAKQIKFNFKNVEKAAACQNNNGGPSGKMKTTSGSHLPSQDPKENMSIIFYYYI